MQDAAPRSRDPWLGRYELGELLGEGGAGRVYAATLHGPGGFRKPVALKVLRSGSDDLQREARLGGLLRHANLVDVFEVGCDGGRWFCAMELCRDGRLADHLPLPPRAVVEVGLQVCDALQYAHEELGLVHLDLKPENLLLDGGTVKVADLGIARARGFDGDGRIRGTPPYMAPEQRRGQPVDARADVHALGVTLAQLATGSASVTVETFSLEEPAPAESAIGDVPAWLRTVVERCTAPRPEDRYGSMSELAAALRGLEADGAGLRDALGIATAPPPSPEVLPDPGNAFLGRGAELERLAALLATPGIVTLKGPGGIGKTRLAAAAAVGFTRAWFCDLTEARDLDEALAVVGRALDVRPGRQSAEEHEATLGRALASHGDALIVLDNFEQIADVAQLVERWAVSAPDLRLLVTSRVALGLAGEWVVEVGPLDAEAAIGLLVARAAERGASIDGDPALPDLVRRLDGVPLALELAAGRLGVLSPGDVLERLDLSLLRGGGDGRHATLRATLDWSWNLLDDEARRALARLSVFRGGLEIEAAEAVLGPATLDVLERLVEQSWLHPARDGRLELLVSIQAYAGEHLDDPARSRAEARHGAFFAGLGSPRVIAERRRTGWRDVERDLPNLEAAVERAVARGDAEVAGNAALAAAALLGFVGPFDRAEALLERARTAVDEASRLGARILVDAARTSLRAGRIPRASEYAARLLALATAHDWHAEVACAHDVLATIARHGGDPDLAEDHLNQAMAIQRRLGDRAEQGTLSHNLGIIWAVRGERERARACFVDALALHREVGDRTREANTLGSLAILDFTDGRPEEASRKLEQGLATVRQLRDHATEATLLGQLANIHLQGDRADEARRCYDAAIALHRRVGNRTFEGVALGNLAELHRRRGQLELARATGEQALALQLGTGDVESQAYTCLILGRVHEEEGRIEQARRHYQQAAVAFEALGDGGNRAHAQERAEKVGSLEPQKE